MDKAKTTITRLTFLKRLGVGLLLLVSSGLAYFKFWAYDTPPADYHNLNAMEYTLSKQLGRIFYPDNNPIGLNAEDVQLTQRLDEQFGLFPGDLKDQMHLLLLVIELSTLLSLHLRPFSHLSQETQIKVLKSWEHSSSDIYRMLLKGSKLLFSLVYFSHEKVKAALGYDPKCPGLA